LKQERLKVLMQIEKRLRSQSKSKNPQISYKIQLKNKNNYSKNERELSKHYLPSLKNLKNTTANDGSVIQADPQKS